MEVPLPSGATARLRPLKYGHILDAQDAAREGGRLNDFWRHLIVALVVDWDCKGENGAILPVNGPGLIDLDPFDGLELEKRVRALTERSSAEETPFGKPSSVGLADTTSRMTESTESVASSTTLSSADESPN